MAKVTIQYWAAAREAAGVELESVEASTLAEALDEIVARRGDDGRLRSVSADLTDIDPPDEFRRVAAGSAAFHPVDLLALCELLEGLAPSGIT